MCWHGHLSTEGTEVYLFSSTIPMLPSRAWGLVSFQGLEGTQLVSESKTRVGTLIQAPQIF